LKYQPHSAELKFFIEWVAINLFGFAALNIIVLPVVFFAMYVLLLFVPLGQTVVWIIFLTISGLVIGILQWRVIRNFINRPSKLWIFSAMLSCAIAGSAINTKVIGIMAYPPETSQSVGLNSITLAGVLVGLISSALQLIIIPVRGYRILIWLFFNAMIGAIVVRASILSAAISQFALGPVAGLLVGLATGLLLLWALEDSFKEPAEIQISGN
jgi:hypothetical protein